MEKVVAFLNGNKVTAVIGGRRKTVTFPERVDAVALKNLIDRYNKGQEGESKLNIIEGYFSDSLKEEFSEGFVITKRGKIFLEKSDIVLPSELQELVKEYKEDGIDTDPLANFTTLLMANPDKHVREHLMKFARAFDFPITDNGYFIGYKSVLWMGNRNLELARQISAEYTYRKANNLPVDVSVVEVKRVEEDQADVCSYYYDVKAEDYMKDLYDNYVERETYLHHIRKYAEENHVNSVADKIDLRHTNVQDLVELYKEQGVLEDVIEACFDENMKHLECKNLGDNLEDLFKEISNMFNFEDDQFTDIHSKKMDIKIGEPVKMERDKCDNDPVHPCSTGLHIGTPNYVSSFGSGSDKVIIACLVNPMNVVAVPHDYSYEKLRCCEYLPYSTCKEEEGQLVELGTKYFEETYINYEKEVLEEKIKDLNDTDSDVLLSDDSYLSKLGVDEEYVEKQKKLLSSRLVTIK